MTKYCLFVLGIVFAGIAGCGDGCDPPYYISDILVDEVSDLQLATVQERNFIHVVTLTPRSAQDGWFNEAKVNPRISLFPQAVASLPCPEYYVEQVITSISVTSTGDWSEALPAGADLSEVFLLEVWGAVVHGNSLSFHPLSSVDYIDSLSPSETRLRLHVNEIPGLEKLHSLSISVELDDGSLFELKSGVLDFSGLL